jgi:hypothetical protein
MEPYVCPNLIVLEENEDTALASLAKFPEEARNDVNSESIQSAIQEQFQFSVSLRHITPYGPDYLINAPPSAAYILILFAGILKVSTFNLALMQTKIMKRFTV